MTQVDIQALKLSFQEGGQGHVFQFFDSLTQEQKESFLQQLGSIDVKRCNRIFTKAISTPPVDPTKAKLEPLPVSAFDSLLKATPAQIDLWRKKGLDLIAGNKVAVILLAGGQGTRLGSSKPKGCYDIGLPSHKSLFQIQAERIARLQVIAAEFHGKQPSSVVIPWYVMTSGPTRKETEEFFQSNNFFGLNKKNIFFFEQGVLPAFTMEGKIFLDEKNSMSVAPDGNGGTYAALRKEGVLADLEKRDIPYIHAYCVDNCLVKVADPIFIGYCVSKGVECGAKAVPKRSPDEPVGVICKKDDKYAVVEYSEIDKAMSEMRNEDGSLVFRAGNIANHFYTTEFLKKIETFESELDYHIAKKAIRHIDLNSGEKVTPPSPNGVKLELFIFDVFPFTDKFTVLETNRAEEFSPLKNAAGSPKGDSPDTSRADILAQHVRFAKQAGANVTTTDLEISPLVTYDGEGLETLKTVTISESIYLASLDQLKK